jgi:hypothetical protein
VFTPNLSFGPKVLECEKRKKVPKPQPKDLKIERNWAEPHT